MSTPYSTQWLHGEPHKTSQKRKSDPETALRKKSTRIIILAYVLVGIILTVDIVAVVAHYSRQRPLSVPQELVGTWTTTAPGYEDRALQITETSLIFHAAESGNLEYAINRIRAEHLEHRTSYTVLYGGRQDQQRLAFEYTNGPDATIQLRNQQHRTWRKQPTR